MRVALFIQHAVRMRHIILSFVTLFPPSLGNGRSPKGYINQGLQIQFGAPDDELYAARNMLSLQ